MIASEYENDSYGINLLTSCLYLFLLIIVYNRINYCNKLLSIQLKLYVELYYFLK